MSRSPKLLPLSGNIPFASRRLWLPRAFYFNAQRLGIPFSSEVLWVRIRDQQMLHGKTIRFQNEAHRTRRFPDYVPTRQRYRISTSRFGIGQVSGSNCTPLGLHRVAEKIGGGLPVGAAFKSRRHIGYTWQGLPQATIAHRILWLEGLEPGFNRGGDVDTHARYIYIHGLADEPTLGRPASHGCIHLAANDLLPLYDRLPSGTLVWIEA